MHDTLDRRFDWRHLIGDGSHGLRQVSVLGAEQRHLSIDIEPNVTDEPIDGLPDTGQLEGVAILAGHKADPALVTRSVRQGGHIYWEVDRRQTPRSRPAEVVRQLEEAGATIVGVWTVRPSFEQPEAFVPIDDEHPLPWFLANVYRTPRTSQRVANRLVQFGLRGDGRRATGWSPLTCIVAVVGHAEPVRSPLLMIHGGHRAIRVGFEHGDRVPRRVIKIPRPHAQDRTSREQDTLHRARQIAGENLATAIPRPLGMSRTGHVESSVESALTGATFAARVTTSHENATSDLLDASVWLSRFHQRSTEVINPPPDVIESWFVEPFRRHGEVFGPDEDALFRHTIDRAHTLQQQSPLPGVLRHADFSIWNLLRSDNGIGVIDWEHATEGPPVCDLIQLCTHWHSHVGRRRPIVPDVDSFRAIFVERRQDSRSDRAVATALASYLDVLDIDERWVPSLVVFNFVDIAYRRQRGRVESGGEQADPRRRNNGLAHLQVMASHLDRI